MKSRFETTEEEDEKAKDAIADALSQSYEAGRRRDPTAKPYEDELWERLLKVLGIGEWSDDD